MFAPLRQEEVMQERVERELALRAEEENKILVIKHVSEMSFAPEMKI